MTSITSKTEAREESYRRLKRLSKTEKREASATIRSRLESWEAFRSAKTVALFAGLANEPDLIPLLATDGQNRDGGKTFCFPKVEGGSMEMFSICDAADLTTGRFGILEPEEEKAERVPADIIDLVLAPGVAFGLKGERIGRGGGYFDRFLPKLRVVASVVGTCFECQVFASLPTEDHDVPMGSIVSEAGVRIV